MNSGERLRVVSWNIAGACPINSLEHFDYGKENTSYFAEQIKEYKPDVVALQESHTSLDGRRVIAEKIADEIGMDYVSNTEVSPSHIDPDYRLGLALLSKHPIEATYTQVFPSPSFPLLWKDGRTVDRHDKAVQSAVINGVTIANTQMLPISLWVNEEGESYNYAAGEANKLAREIEKELLTLALPLILCGDFNFDRPQEIYPNLMREKALQDALPDVTTRPHITGRKQTPNHIYYSPDFTLFSSEIKKKTGTDHYRCSAEFKMN